MSILQAQTYVLGERPRRPIDVVDFALLDAQVRAWRARAARAAEELDITLEEEVAPWADDAPGDTYADLCTFVAPHFSPRLSHAAVSLLLRHKAAMIAVLTLRALPDREIVDWFDRWGQTPLAVSAQSPGGLLLASENEDDVPRVQDHVVIYEAQAGISRAKWILRRALDERERRTMGDLPI